MSIATDFAAFTRTNFWPSRFTDSCVVKRETGESFSDITGVSTPTYTPNYTGACLARPLSASEAVFGQELLQTRGYMVLLPFSETDQLPGDLVDMTSTIDPFFTGKQFVVRNVHGDGYAGKRALVCEEVASG